MKSFENIDNPMIPSGSYPATDAVACNFHARSQQSRIELPEENLPMRAALRIYWRVQTPVAFVAPVLR